MIEQYTSTPVSSFQPHENRVIRAATLFAQGARLLHEESVDLLNIRHAARLRVIADSVQRLVSALQRLGRTAKPEVAHEPSAPQFVPTGDRSSREAVL